MKLKKLYILSLLMILSACAHHDLTQTGADTYSSNINLTIPGRGSQGWATKLNDNFGVIDTYIGGLNSSIDDLPDIEVHTGTFNSSTGTSVSLTKTVDATNEYSVKVTPTSRSTAIGDIWVTKTTSSFTVHCADSNTTDTFEAVAYFKGDVSSYGGSVYRRYYVSPSTSIADHSVVGTTGSLAYVLNQMGSVDGVVELPGNKTYMITSADVEIPAGTTLVFQPGASISVGTGRTFTIDNPNSIVAQPDQIIFSGDGDVSISSFGMVYAPWFGATGNGTTDDTTAIQNAIDAFSGTIGGEVHFLESGTYLCNIELKSYVSLIGVEGVGYPDEYSSRPKLKAYSIGYVIDTPATSATQISIRGLTIIGLGSGTAVAGIRLRDVSFSNLYNLGIYNCADEAIYMADGNANHFERITATSCLLDRTRSTPTGVFYLGNSAHDNYVISCEFGASLTALTDSNMYCNAVMIGGSSNFVFGVVGEFSDRGFYLHNTASGSVRDNKFVGCRADLNYGHGWYIGYTFANMFTACSAHRNSQETTNTYDGWYLTSSTYANNFSGCKASSMVGENVHRYGFNDQRTTPYADWRNSFSGCSSFNHGTAWFVGQMNGIGSSPALPDNGWITATDGDTTPSVDQVTCLILNYTSDETITDFDNPAPGQDIYILQPNWGNDAVHTIESNANIRIRTGTDLIVVQDVVYHFKDYGGVWFLIGDYSS